MARARGFTSDRMRAQIGTDVTAVGLLLFVLGDMATSTTDKHNGRSKKNCHALFIYHHEQSTRTASHADPGQDGGGGSDPGLSKSDREAGPSQRQAISGRTKGYSYFCACSAKYSEAN